MDEVKYLSTLPYYYYQIALPSLAQVVYHLPELLLLLLLPPLLCLLCSGWLACRVASNPSQSDVNVCH